MKLLIVLVLIIFLNWCSSNIENNSEKSEKNTILKKIPNPNSILSKEKEYKENIETNNFKKVDNTITKTIKKNNLVELTLAKVNYNSNINNLLQFFWKNLELIDFIGIWWKKIKWIIKNNSYYLW